MTTTEHAEANSAPPERCKTSDLLPDQCGCRNHRGGQSVDEQILAHRAELLATGRWIPAKFPGVCVACPNGFGLGTAIQRDGDGWRAECCS